MVKSPPINQYPNIINMKEIANRIVESTWFQRLIIGVILFNAVLIGTDTYPEMHDKYGDLLNFLDAICLGIFTLEIALKFIACGKKPQHFFKSSWNTFDFIIVTAAFMPGLSDQTTILRLIRLLRVLRLLSSMPNLQIMIMALAHSFPRIGQMGLLAGLLFYIYAVIGQTLFSKHDPQHWETLHISLLSLFRTLTLEDWTDLMYKGMELYPWAWIYFVSFVLLATFIIFNMLIGIILTSMEEAREIVVRENRSEDERRIDTKLDEIRNALTLIEEHINETKKQDKIK